MSILRKLNIKSNKTEVTKNSPLIAIIIPVYNVERYLETCLNSILQQIYQNWVAILIDDKSSDNSGKICDQYAKKDSRFKVTHKKVNEGSNYARKTGVILARQYQASYITSVDSDDLIHQNYLSDMIEILNKSNAEIIRCGYQKFLDNPKSDREKQTNNLSVYDNQEDIIIGSFGVKGKEWLGYALWGGLYKIDLFDNLNWEVSNTKSNEDMILLMQVYPWVNRVVLLENQLYYYRQRINQGTLSRNFEFTNKGGKIINQFENLVDEFQIFDDYYSNNDLNYKEILFAREVLRSLQVLATAVDMDYSRDECKKFIVQLLNKVSLEKNRASRMFWTKKMKFLIHILNLGGYPMFTMLRECFNLKNRLFWK